MKKEKVLVQCVVNGEEVAEYVDPRESLLDMLRNHLGLTSVKKGCEVGECGACTVIIDGETIDSCIYLAVWAEGKNIRTLEGLEKNGELTRIQEAFIEEGAIQCGFCTPGFVMSATVLLEQGKELTREEIKKKMSGNLCRCTGYQNIVNAVEKVMHENTQERNTVKMGHKTTLLVRGGGDLASGVIHRLYKCGYQVLVLECRKPSAIRRKVSFGEAVFDGISSVEGVTGRLIEDVSECQKVWEAGEIPILVDETGKVIKELRPDALIDAILAKKNLGTNRNMASLTVALGPGFEAGKDVDFVIETQRGHNLGRVIRKGSATPNTGIPGVIAGYGKERVIHSPAAGIMHNLSQIGDIVEKDQILARVDDVPVYASLTGVLRGIIRDGYEVPKGMKIADIDPRQEQKKNCDTISDKARCIAGSVVEILLSEGVLP